MLIAHSFYRLAGGEDRYVTDQVPLVGRRHTVELLSRRNADLRGGLATAARMTSSTRERHAVEEVIDRFAPDVIHLHNAYPSFGPAVHLAARSRSVPLVMTVHNFRLRCPNGYMFTEGAPCRRCERGVYAHAVAHRCFPSRAQAATYAASLWVHRFVLRVERSVDLFITPSEFLKRRLLDWGIGAERVEVVRNFTAIPLGAPDPGSYGMYLGRLSSEKGLDVLLRALAKAGDPPFHIVGDGPVGDALVELARDLGLERTRFVGQVPADTVASHLAGARWVTFASVWDENAPIAALEAMALGRPLLVTRTGGLPELVRNGEGLDCAPGDADGMAEAIGRLVDDEGLCAAAGARARARAEAEFVPDHHLERLDAAYRKVVR